VKSKPITDARAIKSTPMLVEALRGLSPNGALTLEGRSLNIAIASLVLEVPVREVKRHRLEMLDPESRLLWMCLANFATSLDAVDYAEEKVIAEVGEPSYYQALCDVTDGPLPVHNLYRAKPRDRARACVLAKVRARMAVV
jgi:hypothetical protein